MASGREYTRVILTICCIVALILSAISLPAISGEPTASISGPTQPGDGQTGAGAQNASTRNDSTSAGAPQNTSSTSGQSADANAQGGSETGGSGAGSGSTPGALSTGDRTTIGGNLSAFRSTGQQVHFTVQSTQPSYWRTNAYKEYTTTGWEDQGELSPYEGGEISGDTERQQRVIQRYQLNRSGNSLPAAWRPLAVAGYDADIQVTDHKALKTSNRFERGTTYEVVSFSPPRDAEQLHESGTAYPASIANEYTRLPSSTRSQLEPFTQRVVDNPDSPYTAAVRIEEWLETNKEYSLNVSHDSKSDVATEFIFNMDQGYCEYFATAMVAMLRSQDIPARYVTGYSTGQPVGEDEYVVRGMNAHAWVEVYFADIGWVRFDPTPGDERLNTEAQAYAQAGSGSGGPGGSAPGESDSGEGPGSSGSESGSSESGQNSESDGATTTTESGTQSSNSASEYQHQEIGSPGETMGSAPSEGSGSSDSRSTAESGSGSDSSTDDSPESDDGSQDPGSSSDDSSSSSEEQSASEDAESDDDTTDSDDEETEAPLETELNRTELIPGTDVQVTVTRDDEPVAGVTVLFNGEATGDTNQEGIVVGSVPYTAELNVTLATDTSARSLGSLPSLESSAQFDIDTPRISALRAPTTTPTAHTDVDTYQVETNATVNVTGPLIPNSAVLITATINGTALPGATVTVNNATVAETNQSGQARIVLPADVQQTQLQVTRGAVVGERELSLLTQLNVSVEGDFYPTGEAIVNVTARREAVENATVTIGDRELGRTTDMGTVAGPFPRTTGNVTITTTKGVAEGTQTVTLKQLTITAAPERVLAFPWTGVHVESKLANESVGGVSIRINGRPAGETSPEGALNATLPPAFGVTVTAIGYGQRTTTTAGNPLLILFATVVASLLVVGGGVRRVRRTDRTARGSLGTLLESVVGLSQRVFGGIVAIASRADDVLRWVIHIVHRLQDDLTAIPTLLRRWAQDIQQRLITARNWILQTTRRVKTRAMGVARSVDTIVRNPKQSLLLFIGWIRQQFRSDEATTTGEDDHLATAGPTGTIESEEVESRLTVREAWREFLTYVSVRRWQTKTPGQISRRAIHSDGLPPDAVRLLTDSFRDVEYGNRSARDKVEGAREALESIKRAVHHDEEGED